MRDARKHGAALLSALALVAVTACQGPGGDPGPAPSPTGGEQAISVGAFNFPESRLLAELYRQALAAEGLPVAPVIELGSRETAEPALEQGRVDLLVEYAGSALNFAARKPDAAGPDARRTHARLAEALAPRGITVAAAAPAQNQNAFAVRRETAEEFDLRTLSDLAPVDSKLIAGGPPECPQRSTCLAGLRDVYGLEFERFLSVQNTRHVADALREGEIDVGLLFTTDPSVPESDFVILTDDRELQPAENVVPVVRTAVVETHGRDVVEVLDRVSAALTTRELVAMNVSVQVEQQDLNQVVTGWLEEHSLTP